jgi:hypothetical protein
MKSGGWAIAVAVAFLAGWALGRGGSDAAPVDSPGTLPAKPAKATASRSEAPAWGRRLREAPQETQLDEWQKVPPDERGAAMRAWFESFGFSGPSAPDLDKVRAVLDRWAMEDFAAAWKWAEGLTDPIAREFVIVGLVGAISSSDPEKALECFATLGEVQRPIDDFRINGLVDGASNRAVAEGPEALKRVWAKVPIAGSSVNRSSGNYLDLSNVEDIAPFADALREIREAGRRPVYVTGAMKEWAKRDVAAASDYLVDRGLTEEMGDEWRELSSSVREAGGEQAANSWTLETLRKVPLADRGAFLDHISYLHSPQSILSLAPELYQPGERNDHATAFLWATLEREDSVDKLMGLIPGDERGAVIGQLRGVEKTGPLAGYLRRQGTSEEEISRIIGVVGQPWE